MLSSQLRMSGFPPAPAIFASIDCANVRVTYGRVLSEGTRSGSGAVPDFSSADRAPSIVARNSGGLDIIRFGSPLVSAVEGSVQDLYSDFSTGHACARGW